MTSPTPLTINLFADSANLDSLRILNEDPNIAGFTTNPTLMREAGVSNYESFARAALAFIQTKPISFEILSDDFETMYREACTIASWADNVFVKIPITNTQGESSSALIQQLACIGVKQNVTAVMTMQQVEQTLIDLHHGPNAFISIFAGRIADTGRDPSPIMQHTLTLIKNHTPNIKLIWASPREIYNVIQANDLGCHVITLTQNLINKMNLLGKDLNVFSQETVQMFYDDAKRAQLHLNIDNQQKIIA